MAFTLTGLSGITLALQVLLWVGGLLVAGLTLGVAVPALVQARADRTARHLTIPQYYRPAVAH